jgi:serine/threonine-protein kinase HipA
MSKCLYCYKDLNGTVDFHKKCAKTFFGDSKAPVIPYSLNEMSKLAKNVIERSVTVPGVQAKLSMSILNEKDTNTRLTVVGTLGGHFILKPPSKDFTEMPENEHATMRMAELFGIYVVSSSLIRLASGELSYITKRIDRTNDKTKIHMLDMFQITEAYDKYRSSMEKIGKALDLYAANTLLDKLSFYEITIFSFLVGNNDMHLKNFSMIKEQYGWSLAPAYDLLNVTILNPEDTEEFALTIAGKKKKITHNILIEFGLFLALSEKQINGVFKRFFNKKNDAINLIKQSFLSDDMQHKYIKLLKARFKRLV